MSTGLMLLSKPYFGDTRVNRECKSLAASDFSIDVLAWDRCGDGSKVADEEQGIKVELIGPPCKTRAFASFISKLPRFWLACLSAARKRSFSIVHAHDFDTLPIGFLISKMHGASLIYDSHESYADMIAKDVPPAVSRLVRIVERRLMRRAQKVIVANENVAELIGAKESVVLLNCPDVSELPIGCPSPSEQGNASRKKIGYFGSLEPGRFIEEAIDVVLGTRDWQIVVGGDGTLAEAVRNSASKSDSVSYVGHVSHEAVMEQSSKCDALHVLLDPTNVNYRISTPLRLFEAMSLGIPSIVSTGTYPASVVEKEQCGFICDYDKNALSNLLARLSKDPQSIKEKGKNGQQAFSREYNWGRQADKLIRVYSGLVRGN